jgi:predicted secreted protein
MACVNSINPNSGKDLLIQIGNNFSGDAAADVSTEAFTYNDHGLSDGDPVVISALGTVTGPTVATKYFVVNSTANTFQIALTRGGTPILLGGTDDDVTFVEAFDDLTGLTSTSISESATVQEITNKSSNNFREILDQAGIKSMSVSGNGIFSSDWSQSKMRSLFLAQKINRYRIFVVPTDSSVLKYWEGCFKIASMEQSGELDNSQQFSATLESSGEFSYNEV